MKNLNLLPIVLILCLISACGGQKKEESSGSTADTTQGKVSFLKTNPAWGSSEELQKRPSPPVSVSYSQNGFNLAVHYGSPATKGREIWGELVSYDEVWRTGANEATLISFDKDVRFNNNLVPAGNYALFTIPRENEWTVILNSVADQWGAFNYNAEKNIVSFEITPRFVEEHTEQLSFSFEEIDQKQLLVLKWEKLLLEIPFQLP